ncbi:704_t:CDS:2 [Ambispora leptoticha]|uniref:704_t:CDS:1 n=1 Tax=Ambispora leptoticha TaxID=144679 RepID=A0A9N9CYG4_9GLOM|nr:704_t:CDS:2 [Ambispora leptoticha]
MTSLIENQCLIRAWLNVFNDPFTSDATFYLPSNGDKLASSDLSDSENSNSSLEFKYDFEVIIEDIDPLYFYLALLFLYTGNLKYQMEKEVMKYVVENFSDVFKSSGYQEFCENPNACPSFHELNTEILLIS